jgi:uncharacterized heparinase superfamily protein
MRGAIDWRGPGLGSEFQLWRMNLHYMEYLEEVGDADFVALTGEWIEANPPYARGAWKDGWNSYALSLRVVVWMQQIAARGGRASGPVLRSLAAQLRFLERNIESDIGGNHLVKNIKALLWASAFFSGAESARWRAAGLKWLARALSEQVLSDGVHYERSPSYHCQVFADLLEIRHALGSKSPAALDDVLRLMAAATADVTHPDGLVAQFNDAGLHMAYAPGECLDVFETMFGARPAPRRTINLAAAGYFGLRSDVGYFIADCGRVAPDDLPAHGHADILSFEWSVRGQRIVVDPGVFEYVAGRRRDDSRSATSHNTLCLDRADQAEFYGAFRCGERPNVKLRRFEATDEALAFEGGHDGFTHLPGSPRHVRRFEVSARRVDIFDRVEGHADRLGEIGILFHPDVAVEPIPDGLRLFSRGAVIHVQATRPMEVRDAVWWPDMGVERATKRAVIGIDPGVSEVITTLAVEVDDEVV